MLDTYKELVASQFEAALCTLNTGIERCPAAAWDAPVVNLRFCQVAFHALFWADYYLERNAESFRLQPFHRTHEEVFRDYEELEDRAQVLLYERAAITSYVEHCRNKASEVIASETTETLNAPSGFEWLAFSRAEVHIYNIRHLQHHAAQLGLRLRIDADESIAWVISGWRDK